RHTTRVPPFAAVLWIKNLLSSAALEINKIARNLLTAAVSPSVGSDPKQKRGEAQKEVSRKTFRLSLTAHTLWVSPAALIPSMAQSSSSSEVPPVTPTAPMISLPSMINTPPATGTTLPSDIVDSAPRNVGRSFKRSPSERLDSPIPMAPQAFPMATCGRKMLAPSSRFSTFTCPPSSSTAMHIGLNFASLALARALSTINDALSSVSFIFHSSIFLLIARHRVETVSLEPVRQAHGGC